MLSDLRLALRRLTRSPGFTLCAVLSLAIGIGAATGIFSILNAILLRSLPVRAPHELRLIEWSGGRAAVSSYTGAMFGNRGGRNVGDAFPFSAVRAFRETSGQQFASVFGLFELKRQTVAARNVAAVSNGLMVTGNFFAGYGATTLLGRPLGPADDEPGAPPTAVITYGLWERQFGLDPNVIGETLSINQAAFTVVGVLPRDYFGPTIGDLPSFYVTFAAQPIVAANRSLNSTHQWWLQIMARAAPGADETQCAAALTVEFNRMLAQSLNKMSEPRIVLAPGYRGTNTALRERAAALFALLLAIVCVVIAIACANVAGLMLAHGAARQHELAVRAAIGASRWRLLRQSFAESLLLGLAAAGAGFLLSDWVKQLVLRSLPALPDNLRLDTRTDGTVLAFAIGAALVTAFVFGLLPALRASRADPLDGLQHRAMFSAPRLRTGKVLVAAQVALSMLLLVAAGLTLRSFVNLQHVEPGFNAENVLMFRMNPKQAGYKDAALVDFFGETRRAVAALSDVRSVALSSFPLVSDSFEMDSVTLPGRPVSLTESRLIGLVTASDGYLETLGIRLLAGRDISATDTAAAPPVAIVNEEFARRFFDGGNPIGHTFVLADGRGRTFTIIGLARNAKYQSLRAPVPPIAYLAFAQSERNAMYVVARTGIAPLSIVPAVRRAIAKLNPQLAISDVRAQKQLLDQSIGIDRLYAILCTTLSAIALLLAAIGLYGLVSFNVARRIPEIGVRIALGATPRDIAWPIVRGALRLTAAGAAVGTPFALAAALLLRSRWYGVGLVDPVTLIAGASVLATIAAVSAWLPARRAAHTDPIEALRLE